MWRTPRHVEIKNGKHANKKTHGIKSLCMFKFINTQAQRDAFESQGFIVIKGAVKKDSLDGMRTLAEKELVEARAPLELESTLAYPGAPTSQEEQGGRTPRRLLDAYNRQYLWRDWASNPQMLDLIRSLLDTSAVSLSLAHHNCLMCKSPDFSSRTGWHQDIRYWSFQRPELISVWLALGDETHENGAIHVIPGSHRCTYLADQFDPDLFFRDDLDTNTYLLDKEEMVNLEAGDVLVFDCKLLHRAGKNHTSQTKFSLVFTYRDTNNKPRPGTRSSVRDDVHFASVESSQ